MSGIKGANSGGGNTTFLKIAGNAIWQTAGNIDVNNPLYAEEDYEFGEKTGTRKGYKIGSILGTLNSVFFKETKFGEMMNVYMDVNTGGESTERYCLGLSLDGGWDKHQVCKRMMLGLMYLDTSEEFEINVSQNKGENDFTSTTLWITQGGKNLVLNPDVDPEKVDLERQIEMPISVLELIADIRTPDRDEMKDLQPKKKIRLREDELDDLKAVMESEVIPRLNQGSENNGLEMVLSMNKYLCKMIGHGYHASTLTLNLTPDNHRVSDEML
jgi:hypothetical protein